jgi:hypothetical protein
LTGSVPHLKHNPFTAMRQWERSELWRGCGKMWPRKFNAKESIHQRGFANAGVADEYELERASRHRKV